MFVAAQCIDGKGLVWSLVEIFRKGLESSPNTIPQIPY
jgi:hypothetical protein